MKSGGRRIASKTTTRGPKRAPARPIGRPKPLARAKLARRDRAPGVFRESGSRRQPWVRAVWEALYEGPRPEREVLRTVSQAFKGADARHLVEDLVAEGWLVRVGPGRLMAQRTTGELRMNPRGFGFVGQGQRESDVFVPGRLLNGAFHGDEVSVWVRAGEGRGPEGQVMDILRRGNARLVGRLESRGGRLEAVPADARLPAVQVGRVRDRGAARVNDWVVAEVVSWPTRSDRRPRGRIVEVLGPEGAPGLDVRVVMEEQDLPARFPESALQEARRLPQHVRAHETRRRLDLTGDLVVTIDGADAKDLDDAISLKVVDEGYELGVHIADVSHYVPYGSALDQEALKRGTSVYLVDRVVPMFPPELSNQIASLNPHQKRLTVSCFVRLAPDGRVLRTRFQESVIQSRHRLTYEAVNSALAGEPGPLAELMPWLREAHTLAERLRARRLARGAVDFDLPEAKVRLDEKGRPVAIDVRDRGPAESLIEEFMLLANEAVAQYLADHRLPALYRVHEAPTEEKLKDFRVMAGALGYRLPEPVTPMSLQALLAEAKGTPEERVITEALLRSMQQARYAAENLGHFGLASPCYTHFTSPIRRYPDLFVHRVLKAHLSGKDVGELLEQWRREAPAVAEQASRQERAAMEAERASVQLKQVQYMADKLGETFSGVISGVTAFGLFVELDNLVEGLIRVEDLPDDQYRLDPVHYTLTGVRRSRRFRLGDPVVVQVARVDQEARRIDFHLVEEQSGTVRRAPRHAAAPRRRRSRSVS